MFRRDGGEARYLLIRDSYRNWGFPKGHIEVGEPAEVAAVREVGEETGLKNLAIRGLVDTIEWEFRFRGHPIHKTCHFFLMETPRSKTSPLRAEGITACRWTSYAEAERLVSYRNAREVLRRARHMIATLAPSA